MPDGIVHCWVKCCVILEHAKHCVNVIHCRYDLRRARHGTRHKEGDMLEDLHTQGTRLASKNNKGNPMETIP